MKTLAILVSGRLARKCGRGGAPVFSTMVRCRRDTGVGVRRVGRAELSGRMGMCMKASIRKINGLAMALSSTRMVLSILATGKMIRNMARAY